MAHAFLMADRVAVYELAKHGGFRYRANVDLEENLALEAYREEYGQILFVTLDEAERRRWDRIPEGIRSLVTPTLEDAVKRHIMVRARCLQLH